MISKQLTRDTEKPEGYLRLYEEVLAPMVDKEVKLLELGIFKGGSLLMWRDYFAKGTIVGVDLNEVGINDPTGRIRTYFGRQDDVELLDRIAHEQAPDGFDIIVDDCAHIGEIARNSFWHLFEHHLKPGGIYAIEDWGTGYFGGHNTYPDGRRFNPGREAVSAIKPVSPLRRTLRRVANPGPLKYLPPLWHFLRRYYYTSKFRGHDRGMVGFVKQLVDECGMIDLTNHQWGKPPQVPPRISHMIVRHGLVIVFKVQGSFVP